MGCHLSSCGFSSFSHPLEDLFLFWPVSTFATFFSLSHHAALAGRGGAAGDSWIVQGRVLQIGWGESRVPPSLLPPPKSNGPVSGEISHYTSWLFPYLVLAWVPHPGQLSHKWESGWEAWPSRVLRWPVSAILASPFLCTGPLPPACCLKGPCRFLISTATSSPTAPGGSLTASRLTSVHQAFSSIPESLCLLLRVQTTEG